MSDPSLSMYPAHRIVWKVVASGRLLPILQPTEENPILSGKLIISVLRARNLFSTVLYGKMDPFVEIRVGNVKKRTSVHKKGDVTPQWDEHLDFLLKGTEDYIKVTLKNKKMLMNEIIGVAFIPVDYLLLIHGRKTARASFTAGSPAQAQGDNKQAPVYNDPSQAWFDIGREAKQTKLAGTLLLGFRFEPMQISDNMMQQLMNDEEQRPTPLNRTLSDADGYLDGAQSVNSITARLMQEKALRSRSLHEEDLEPGQHHGSPMKNSTMPALSMPSFNNHGRSPSTIRSLKLFGGPLSNGVNRSKSCVPVVCYVCIQYLLHHGLDVEGIFRVPGSQQRIEEIKDAFEHGESVNICDPHVTAGVLKLYFRKLAEPLIPCLFYKGFVEVEESEKSDTMKYKRLADLVQLLPSDNRTVLSYLLHFLSKVAANSAINKMNVKNLAVVFGPSLLRPTNEEDGMALPPSPSNAAAANQMIKQMEAANTCVAHLISGYDTIFPAGPPEPFKMDHPHLARPSIINPRHPTNRLSDPSIQFDPDNRPQS